MEPTLGFIDVEVHLLALNKRRGAIAEPTDVQYHAIFPVGAHLAHCELRLAADHSRIERLSACSSYREKKNDFIYLFLKKEMHFGRFYSI